jgi:hypothetical protein
LLAKPDKKEKTLLLNTELRGGNPVIFSSNVYTHSDGFGDRHTLLDTCAGESVFKNRNLFHTIEPSVIPMEISGVNPKGSPLIITECGDTDFGIVYFDSNCIANILSFGNVVNYCKSVSYNSRHDFYIVQVTDGGYCYKFSRDSSSNSYSCDLDTMVSFPREILVTTVNHKKKKYSGRQVKLAEVAREYQRNLGYASPGQLIKMIGQGQLGKCEVTTQDAVRAPDIWGPDLDSLKGKTISHKAQLEKELPTIKKQLFEDQTMYLNLMFLNSVPYLITVVNPLEY